MFKIVEVLRRDTAFSPCANKSFSKLLQAPSAHRASRPQVTTECSNHLRVPISREFALAARLLMSVYPA